MGAVYKSVCYCTNLRRCANGVSELYDETLKDAGLTISQYYLLINLSRLGSANITHWAQRVGLDRSTMVRNVQLLQTRGLIVQTEGHGKTFGLSEDGKQRLDRAIPLWEQAQGKLEAILGKEDAAALLRIGSKLQDAASGAQEGK